jgi:predicted PurR-regulated permease PerM
MLIGGVTAIVDKINGFVDFQLISSKLISQSSSLLTGMASTIVNTTYSFAANIFMMIIILYFMLANARTLEEKASKYMPFSGHSREELTGEVTSIIYSNAVGIPLIMLGQGVVAGLIYLAFGMHNVVFWAFLTALCGLIPMIGTVIVSVPLGIYFIVQGMVLKGILLMLCGVLIIANVDNLFRIILNQRISKTHPLIVIFGVIMGIPLFGFWGIIFGPLLISVFLLLIRIYYKEYKLLEPESPPILPPSDTEN